MSSLGNRHSSHYFKICIWDEAVVRHFKSKELRSTSLALDLWKSKLNLSAKCEHCTLQEKTLVVKAGRAESGNRS